MSVYMWQATIMTYSRPCFHCNEVSYTPNSVGTFTSRKESSQKVMIYYAITQFISVGRRWYNHIMEGSGHEATTMMK